VEVMVAFVILPLKGERYIMIPQLRVVTLLNDQIRQVQQTNLAHQIHETYTTFPDIRPRSQGDYQLQRGGTAEA